MKIVISCGELSGDEHGARVIASLKQLAPSVQVKGMGGHNLRAAGVELAVDAEKAGSAMGFVELLPALRKILGAFSQMKKLLREFRPDVLILVDYPDFNLRLAKYAKRRGIPVLYYIIPKMWAWRAGRVKLFKRYVDCAAVIFPFEKKFLQQHGYDKVIYVGHPFADQLSPALRENFDREGFFAHFGLDVKKPVVAIFPGSRKSEIMLHAQTVVETAAALRDKIPAAQIVIGVASSLHEDYVRNLLAGLHSDVKLLRANSIEILLAADVGILKSGTSNLQAAFCGLPFVMFFRCSTFGEWIVQTFVRLTEYSIVNVIRSHTIKEYLQKEAIPENMVPEILRLLSDTFYRERALENLHEVVDALSTVESLTESSILPLHEISSTSARVAAIACGMLHKNDLTGCKKN